MINVMSKKIADFLAEKAGYGQGEDRYQSMLFFIKAIIHNVVKMLFLLTAVLWISLKVSDLFFAYMVFLMCIYGMIKRFSFGVHSANEVLCTVVGLIYYLGGTFLAMEVEIHFLFVLLAMCVCFMLNWKYSPAPTQKRKIGEKEEKKLKGYVLFVYGDVFLLAIVFILVGQTIFLNLILLAVAWQTVTVLPITYRLLGERRE